ncbi:hypothetical protein CSE16_12075 [Solibacillus sp. R5-41]|uniref:hypothetical protein n=1 Tax=Solibacillus sp. R5-41 TaxID=2048654 RepID=UPI000C125B3D|nr:hypothetical protein [Solibacillus sp. R5-41]ATP40724.1 hypothetical protein CSE16_12075 [Solibacillus sp. R5-41]
MDYGIENTMFSGIGFEFSKGIEVNEKKPVDYQGKRLLKGEEYYIFDRAGEVVYVHIEEVRDYLQDTRLDEIECYETLIQAIDALHDNYPIIM